MKLTDLHIDEFGALRGLSLPSLPTGLSGLYGPNGSGKTTLMYFLRGAMGDKSDAAAESLWEASERHCGSISVQRRTGQPSEAVTIRGGLKTKRELLGEDSTNTSAAARLATLVASEAVDAKSLLELAHRLGLDVTSESRDRDAERRYEQTRNELSEQIRSLSRKLADARPQRSTLEQKLRKLRIESEQATARLDRQEADVAAAVRSADSVTARRHADYQTGQAERREWEDDAWRPRATRTVTRTVPKTVTEVVAAPVAALATGSTIESALTEISRLRCQATARRNVGLVQEVDSCGRCDDDTRAVRDRIATIRGRLHDGSGDAASLDADLTELTALLDRHDETIDWLRADRAIALLDRCERDLLRVRGTLGTSVCGAAPAEPQPIVRETTATEVIVEDAADAELGRFLLERREELRRRWQTAITHGVQVRRHLEQIRAERRRLVLPDLIAIERQIEELTARIGEWDRRHQATEAELASLVKPDTRGPNPIMDAASDYFRRMTCEHYRGLTLRDRKKSDGRDLPRLVAVTRGQHVVDARTLSRGTAGQAALSLRLAMLDAITDSGQRWPLLLDDALVDSDHERMAAGVSVLRDWAADRGGRQVVVLTCQRQLVEALHEQNVSLRTLPGGQHVLDEVRGLRPPSVDAAEPIAVPLVADVDRDVIVTKTVTKTVDAPVQFVAAEPIGSVSDTAAAVSEQITGPQRFWLTLETELIDLPSIDKTTARRLRTLSLVTIDDLILADSADLESRLVRLQINPEHFRRWQAEADLLATVPELSARDAQVLAFVGIDDGSELAAISLDDLTARIQRGRSRSGGSHLDWDGLSSHRMHGWIQRARRSRHASRRRAAAETRSNRRTESDRTLSVMERRRKDRQKSETKTETTWKHYLHKSSPVVDAPSIGPKMAKRLGKLGIVTVGDLLACDAGRVAKQLDDRRVSKQDVTDWIDQSRLMCRIPQLRGHDAQVLVAVGYRTLDDLEGRTAKAVWAKVGPFVATKDGQRLLRSSRTPDLDEVTDWMTWIGHSRSLKAA